MDNYSLRITDYYEVFNMATQLFIEVNNENYYSPKEWIDYHGIDYLDIVFVPKRKTLLHHYINDVYEFHLGYLLNKHFPRELIDSLIEIFKNYKYSDSSVENMIYSYNKYCDINEYYDGGGDSGEEIDTLAEKFLNIFRESLMPTVVDDVFTVLFQNKAFLRNFNQDIADLIGNMTLSQYPKYLASDGMLKRSTYLPQWLKKGVYLRDKGRCQLCGKDLTGLLRPNDDVQLDHIIPLGLGGCNDPTNFQLACESCNLSKNATNCETNDIMSPFWELND